MFEKQIEKLLSQMSSAQKNKVANMMKDEESLKKAIASLDPNQLKKVTDSLGMKNVSKEDLNKMTEQFATNPDKLREIERKF